VTSDQAKHEAERLSREHDERGKFRWFAQQSDGDVWTVVRVPRPPGMRSDPLSATTEARPKPPQAEGPRDASSRNVPGYGA
jgi:hypothetical protein